MVRVFLRAKRINAKYVVRIAEENQRSTSHRNHNFTASPRAVAMEQNKKLSVPFPSHVL